MTLSKKKLLVLTLGCVTVVGAGLASQKGVSPKDLTGIKDASAAPVNYVTRHSNSLDSTINMNSFEEYLDLIGQPEEKAIKQLNESPVTIDEGGLEFKKAGLRLWFKDAGNGMVVSQIFTQKKDIDFNGARIGDKLSSFKKALGNPVSDENGEAYFKYQDVYLSFNYHPKTEDTVCGYFLSEGPDAQNAITKPQVEVPVDMKIEANEQKSVDAGHSPWKLDPAFVAQVFVSLKISPQGIQGEYPIKYDELQLTKNTGKEAIAEVNAVNTPISKVYLKKLIKQDSTGIWTVIGYDPVQ